MFLVKKIVALFFYPVSLCLGILILGLWCLWVTRRQRLGKGLVTLGALLLLLMSLPFISSGLLTPLEYRYPPLLNPEIVSWGQNGSTSPKWIVVLGGGHVSDPRLPANSQISAAALGRVVEGVRLYKAIPGSKLLLSGGAVFDPVPEAEVMARIAGLLGVNPQDIMLEMDSRDTADEAKIIAKIIDKGKCILVTSAAHMPRSMALFRKRGLQPIPAPTDYLVQEGLRPAPGRFFPGAGGLWQVQVAVHEYLGLVWAWLRGAI
ncbi:MAG: hypothetical protein A2139_04525 [Desulfobacca sp. RBG_16_60_12]|nr:MAG: hypothetical protein A2139_04525 [Desulfobacca sp. RBG_16_60_12]